MLTVPVGSIVDWRSTSALPLRAHSGKRTWSESGRIGDAVQGGGDVRPVGDKAVAAVVGGAGREGQGAKARVELPGRARVVDADALLARARAGLAPERVDALDVERQRAAGGRGGEQQPGPVARRGIGLAHELQVVRAAAGPQLERGTVVDERLDAGGARRDQAVGRARPPPRKCRRWSATTASS